MASALRTGSRAGDVIWPFAEAIASAEEARLECLHLPPWDIAAGDRLLRAQVAILHACQLRFTSADQLDVHHVPIMQQTPCIPA